MGTLPDDLLYTHLDSPVGPLLLAATDHGLIRARVNMFDVDPSAPGRMPRGYPGDEDLYVFRTEVDVVAMPPLPPGPPGPPGPPAPGAGPTPKAGPTPYP